MVFYPPSWSPTLPPIPDSISLERFMFDERYGRHSLESAFPPFTCGVTGKSYSATQVKQRVEFLSRSLAKLLPAGVSEWRKVVGIFSSNAIDYLTVAWAVHRLGGVVTTANAAYNEHELHFQVKHSGSKVIFTCGNLLDTCLKATKGHISPENIFLLPVPGQSLPTPPDSSRHWTIEDLINEGSKLSAIEAADQQWSTGEGARCCAFLCYSSGTSGLPKGVMISHFNVIANILQMVGHEAKERDDHKKRLGLPNGMPYKEKCLGLMPMSHIYALIIIAHIGPYRGDGIVVMPKYQLETLLRTIEVHRINMLYIAPPVIMHLTQMQNSELASFDLSSVRIVYTGGAPLAMDTANRLLQMYPRWVIRQGYGLTETATVACVSVAHDIWLGSSGSILPGCTARILTSEGKEVTNYRETGELYLSSPSIAMGYRNNDVATRESFVELDDGQRYMRTGDEVMIDVSPNGHEHVFIVDRIKELIKVKGLQVAPAELEELLQTHPKVQDVVVIGVPSQREGEVPKAFVVRKEGSQGQDAEGLKRVLITQVEKFKSNHKWLRGGVDFIDEIPKSPSGKVLRREIRDRERRKVESKL